jgi:hypothetical protein
VLLNEYENTPFQSEKVKAADGWQAQSPTGKPLTTMVIGFPANHARYNLRFLLLSRVGWNCTCHANGYSVFFHVE